MATHRIHHTTKKTQLITHRIPPNHIQLQSFFHITADVILPAKRDHNPPYLLYTAHQGYSELRIALCIIQEAELLVKVPNPTST
ncbi:MAG: hypothetical protein EZS28_001533 [Streblomastix strix]|uniref:Uncharacterized protein n=1 Tax=Streblomastix strix TaxID=222440 RepID=A0A5J4X6W1_9EUKA|nr:MAG: hypothetical protein EZS28_001533 [Streblomastix strix]